jgi:hypothetical protein
MACKIIASQCACYGACELERLHSATDKKNGTYGIDRTNIRDKAA